MFVGFNAIGLLSWVGEDVGGLCGALVVRGLQSDCLAVFVLFGIFGFNFVVDGQCVWFGFYFFNGLKKFAWDLAIVSCVTLDGLIGLLYDLLIEYFGVIYEVIFFVYDWCRLIEDEA